MGAVPGRKIAVQVVPVEANWAGSSVCFNVRIFIEQLLYQELYPVSIPLVWLYRGSDAITNMRFALSLDTDQRSQLIASVFQLHLAILWLASVVTFAQLEMPSASDALQLVIWRSLQFEVSLVSVAVILQRAAIACKYAYLQSADYEWLMTRRTPYARLEADQLIAGWAKLSDEVLERELDDAATRLAIPTEQVVFDLDTEQVFAIRQQLQREQPKDKSINRHSSVTGTSMKFGAATLLPRAYHNSVRSVLSAQQPAQLIVITADNITVFPLNPAGAHVRKADETVPTAEPLMETQRRAPLEAHCMTVSDLAKRLINRADAEAQPVGWAVNWIIVVASFVKVMLPVIVRSALGLPLGGSSGAHSFIFGCCAYLNFWFPLIVLSYLRVGLIDYMRRANSLHMLGDLARRRYENVASDTTARSPEHIEQRGLKRSPSMFRDHSVGQGETAIRLRPPLLPFQTSTNVVLWLSAHRLLKSFGERYQKRISAYSSQALICAIVLMVALAAELLVSQSTDGVSVLPIAAVPTVTFLAVATWDLTVLSCLLMAALWYGISANDSTRAGVVLIEGRKLELDQLAASLRTEGRDEEATAVVDTTRVLAGASSFLALHGLEDPVQILSVPATRAVLKAIAAGFVSGLAVGIQSLSDKFR